MDNDTIANQVIQNQDRDGMLRRALERIIQLYTDKSHFVYELLQNAEDAGANQIKFLQYEDRLEVLHDGHPFSRENLQGLCDIGKSDKIGNLNQIGEFGVGFKSVFGICENVRLYSHPYKEDGENGFPHFAIEIQDFINPVDIEDEEIPQEYTTRFVFPYSVGFTFSGFQTINKLNEALSKRLRNLGITTLLFMKNLKSIDYQIILPELQTSGTYMLEKRTINDHCILATAKGEMTPATIDHKIKEEKVLYLVFSRPVSGIQTGRTIDIAFALSINNKGEYQFRRSKYPYISVYFPTETESKLDFIVQGPYRTTPNRSSVPAEDRDNIHLANLTAQLLKDSIKELRDKGILNMSLLNILPINEYAFENAPLFKCMYTVTLDMMKSERFLLCKDGSYSSPKWVKIARGDKFSEIFSEKLITELLNDKGQYHWLPTFLTETNRDYKNLYEYLTGKLGIEVMRPENMRNYINNNPDFLRHRSDVWLIKMYLLYENVGGAFSKHKGESNMLTANFIKTSTGNFVAPYRKSSGKDNYEYSYYLNGYTNATYLPNVFLPPKKSFQMQDIPLVDRNIYNSCQRFFKEILGLQEPNEYEFFVRDFEKRYTVKENISDNQHIEDIKQLLKYRNNDSYRNEVDNLIEKYLVLRCYKMNKKIFANPRRAVIYFSVTDDGMSIELYFRNISDYTFIDEDFYKQKGIDRDNLRLLGVKDNISIGNNITEGEYYTGNPGRQPYWNTYGDFRWKLTLIRLDEVLEYISNYPERSDSMAKSNFIYRFLFKNEAFLTGTVHIGGSTPDIHNAVSKIVSTLQQERKHYYKSKWNGKWLYTENNKLVSQKEISKRNLNTQLYGNIHYDSQLYDILGFKKNDVDRLEDAARDYDRIPEETRKKYFEIEFQRRFGIPVSEGKELLEGKTSITQPSELPAGDTFEFPSSRVKSWESLRKHVAQVLCYANPIKYEYKVRSIRVSRPSSEVKAYLINMYRIEGKNKCACQMCHSTFSNVEMCQISNKMYPRNWTLKNR